MNKKRKVAVITSSRADYWLLKELIFLLHQSDNSLLQLVVMGAHLSPSQGNTIKKIEQDNFPIAAKIESMLASDTNIGMAKSIGLTTISMTDCLVSLQPDVVVVLGDRYEIFAAAQAAYALKIPVAHIHGGEKTSGALDDNFRHATTKFSVLHFVSHAQYAKRVLQLGENADQVFTVGATCIDQIAKMQRLSRDELLQKIELSPNDKYVICTYHPSTLDNVSDVTVAENILLSLLDEGNSKIIITKANMDPAGQQINILYEKYKEKFPDKIRLFDTLGGDLYFNCIAHCEFFVGNSSSGIIEVPYFKKATINIGRRQEGRAAPESIFNTHWTQNAIKNAMTTVQNLAWIQGHLHGAKMIYGEIGNVSKKIYDTVTTLELENLIYKQFMDRL